MATGEATPPMPQAQQAAGLTPDGIAVLDSLEDFLARPGFTGVVEDFVSKHGDSFSALNDPKAATEEQPLHWYDRYKEYVEIVDAKLEEFLTEAEVSAEEILEVCRVQQECGGSLPLCIDYLLASTEYESFLRLMADCNAMASWVPDEQEEQYFGLGTGMMPGSGNDSLEGGALEEGVGAISLDTPYDGPDPQDDDIAVATDGGASRAAADE